MNKINYNYTTETINNLISIKQLNYNTSYQRHELWNENKQICLIISILQGFPLSLIYIKYDEDNVEIVDGKQRLCAIQKFKKNKLDLHNPYYTDLNIYFENRPYKYMNLKIKNKLQFDKYKLPLCKLFGAFWTKNHTSELFYRIQNGLGHSLGESLNGMENVFAIIEIKNKLTNLYKLNKDKRYGRLLFLCKLFYCSCNEKENYKSCTNDKLKMFFLKLQNDKKYQTSLNKKVDAFISIMEYLNKDQFFLKIRKDMLKFVFFLIFINNDYSSEKSQNIYNQKIHLVTQKNTRNIKQLYQMLL